MQSIEQDISVQCVVAILKASAIFEQDVAFKAKLGRPGGSLTCVVRLRCALRDDGIGALTESVCQQKFKLASLVAAAREAGAIVALYPEARSIEMLGKPFQWF
jgi:hypothetical protein